MASGQSVTRWSKHIAFVTVLMFALLGPTATLALADGYHIVRTGGVGVRQRLSPEVNASYVGVTSEGTPFTIVCQLFVPTQPMGDFGNTLWFKVTTGGPEWFLNDTFTDTPRTASDPALSGFPMCGEPYQSVNNAVTCYGDYCSGQDPEITGCAQDAITVAYLDIPAARLELRWSDTCRTNWARYVQYPRGWYLGNVPLELRAVQDTGYTQRLDFDVNGNPTGDSHRIVHNSDGEQVGPIWSPMIYSPVHLVRAELVVQCGPIGNCLFGAITGQNPIATGWA